MTAKGVAFGVLWVMLPWSIVTAQGRGRSGPPTPVYRTETPPLGVNAILVRPTETSVTLSLLADTDHDIAIRVSPGGLTRSQHLAAGIPTEVLLDHLRADQAYTYRIEEGTGASARVVLTGQFHTARARGATYRVVVQADSHLDGNTDPAMYARSLQQMVDDTPDFLLDLGDTFMTDKYPAFQDAAPQYRAQRYYFGIPGRVMPVFLVTGNHDGESVAHGREGIAMAEWSRATRRRYFPQITASPFYSAGPLTQHYYAFRWGDATFIVLDPYSATTEAPNRAGGWAWTLGRTQYAWLEETLAAATTPYVFVSIHHLVGGREPDARGGVEASSFFEWGGANADGSPGFAAHRPGWPRSIHELLVQYGVTAVLHGHDHLYVRQERDGITYLEVPQPGFAREGSTRSATEYGYTSGILLGSPGFVRLTIGPSGADLILRRTNASGVSADSVRLAPRKIVPSAGTP